MLRRYLAVFTSCVLLSPTLAQADAVHDALEDYALYQSDVSDLLDSNIENTRDVDAALARLSRHNPSNVARGWIAYGALTAVQSPQFAQGIERSARGGARASVLRSLRDDLSYARREHSTAQAIGLILSVAGADSARVEQAGDRYDRFARSGGPVLASARGGDERGGARLTSAMLERLNITPVAARPMNDADAFGGRGFWDSLAGRDVRALGGRGGGEARDYASVTDHMLTLGALVAVDATASERTRVSELLNEPLTQNCMHMQQLQLRQCLSVSVDATERSYCLGHHALTGPGACFANVVR